MKILIASDYFQPKIGYTKVQVAQNLMKTGHQVRILTSDRYFPFHNYESTVKKLIGKRVREAGQKRENGFLVERKKTNLEIFTRVFFSGIEESIKGFTPDLIIVFGISTNTCYKVSKLKSKLNFKLVIADSHLPSELNHGNQFFKKIFYFLFRFLFSKTIENNADKVIAIQDKTKNLIKNFYGIKKNIEVVPNGTDISLFRFSAKARISIRKKLNIGRNDFVIIYTGKIIKQKGLEILFSAFDSLKARKKIHLLLVGDGPKAYIKKCYEKVDKNKHKLIHALGFKDQKKLFKYYSAADVAIWPLQESLAMNDAASCSLPFIANSSMGDKTRISNNNAFLYKKGSVTDLIRITKKLIESKSLRIKMGKNGRRLMIDKLSWKKITKKYLA